MVHELAQRFDERARSRVGRSRDVSTWKCLDRATTGYDQDRGWYHVIPMESMDASPQGAGNVDSRPFGAVPNATYGLESGV